MWLHKTIRNHPYENVHFVARDGYLIKKVFDKIGAYLPTGVNTNYLHLSRRSILPMTLHGEQDLFALFHLINYANFTPADILSMFLRVSVDEDLIVRLRENGVIATKAFSSGEEFNHFANTAIHLGLMGENLQAYRDALHRHFDRIFTDNDAIFDIGYNGTTQIILSNFLDKKIDGFYVHLNKDKSLRPNNEIKSNVYSFLDYTPSIKGTIREYMFSEPSPSCMEYEQTSEKAMRPIFEEDRYNTFDQYVLERMHQGVLDFVDEFLGTYHEYLDLMTFRNYDVSLPIESFLHLPAWEDQKLFAYSTFDDIISGNFIGKLTLLDIWNQEMKYVGITDSIEYRAAGNDRFHHLEGKGTIRKAIYFLLFDLKSFRKRVVVKFKYKVLKRPLQELVKDL